MQSFESAGQGVHGEDRVSAKKTKDSSARQRTRRGDSAWGSIYDAKQEAIAYADKSGALFVHPFDDPRVIEGQGTVGYEIDEQLRQEGVLPDHVFIPVGGGGLLAGVATYFGERRSVTTIHGIEPDTSAAMNASVVAGEVVTLPHVSAFVDGVAVRRVGDLPFAVVQKYKPQLQTIPENAVCSTMLDFYQRKSMLVEPAGALSVAALNDDIRGKVVVCIISGGNVDMERWPEIQDRAEYHRGMKCGLLVELPQTAGPLNKLTEIFAAHAISIAFIHYDKRAGAEQGAVDLELESTTTADALSAALMEIGKLGYNIKERRAPRRR